MDKDKTQYFRKLEINAKIVLDRIGDIVELTRLF